MALTKISGSVIKDSVSLSGNVSVGGTLTYQDVTNVDALGIGTFRTGIKVLAGQVDVGSNIKLGNAGVITATSFVGSGANLTGITQVGGSTGVDFNDNVKARFGTGNDLEIYHNGVSNILGTSNGNIELVAGSEYMAKFIPNGEVQLYNNNTRRLRVTSGGLSIQATDAGGTEHFGRFYFKQESGTVRGLFDPAAQKFSVYDNSQFTVGNDRDAVFYHDGSNTILLNNTGNLLIRNDGTSTTEEILIQPKSGENSIRAIANGAVELYHDGTRKFRTTSGGVRTDANLEMLDNHELQLGNNVDLKIFHESSSNDNIIDCATTRPLRIRFGGSNQFEFLSAGGIKMNDGRKIFLGDSSDFEIFHDGLDSFIKDTGTGSLKVCSNLFRVNNAANSEAMIKAEENAGVTLSYDANTKFETTSSGVTVTGTCSATAFSGSSGTLTGVAFAAVRTAGNSNNTPFVFNSEEFDIGSDYNASTGIFTAPDIGYYHITVQMTSTAYSGNRHIYLESSTNGGSSWTERANALTGTPGGANESINMFIGGIFKTTVTNQQFRVRTGWTFQGTGTYARFSAFKI